MQDLKTPRTLAETDVIQVGIKGLHYNLATGRMDDQTESEAGLKEVGC